MESSTAQFLWRQFACVQLPKRRSSSSSSRRGGPPSFSSRVLFQESSIMCKAMCLLQGAARHTAHEALGSRRAPLAFFPLGRSPPKNCTNDLDDQT